MKIFLQVRRHNILLNRPKRRLQSIGELYITLSRQVCIVRTIRTMLWLAIDKNVIATDEDGTFRPLLGISGDVALLSNKDEYYEAAVHLKLIASNASSPVCGVDYTSRLCRCYKQI